MLNIAYHLGHDDPPHIESHVGCPPKVLALQRASDEFKYYCILKTYAHMAMTPFMMYKPCAFRNKRREIAPKATAAVPV